MKFWERFSVEGLTCVVTGAASGIGLAYAEVMAEAGAQVTLLDIDGALLHEQVTRLKAQGLVVHGEVVDATDRSAMYACFERIGERYGRLDVVFANAGIDSGPGFLDSDGQRCEQGALENIEEAHWDKVLATNLTSVFTTLRAAVRLMKPKGSGRIIVTTSNAAMINEAIVGTPYMPAKAGAASLVRQAAMELARFGINVNAIAPGPFVTNIAGGRLRNPADRAAFALRVPQHRIASTEEIKGLALFLASPAASYVTGAQIVIDGGQMLGRVD
ncbi:SDR family NAD(P)-dependent oxidoreductase [Pseudomonas sp.]|uniref:SDR family NAD(P)-dependent oxidoreductase n=1 Tax=Pseudomonas sp. TaxID=306 RepID=UPI00260F6639|nr:SDR family NAD(P)-dependent oxidoreductase [Pseudomonas sp.]